MLVVDHLFQRFNDHLVLEDIHFKVEQGELLVIMGASGTGKSTLLKNMSGLLMPTSGDVLLNGISMVKYPEIAAQKTGFVFQNSALFDYLTVEENILFGVKRKKHFTLLEQNTLVKEMLAEVSLDEIEKFYPSELSGGMQKRVSLARALSMEPEVLFYDEPTSGLDPITALSIDELILRTRNHLKITSIVVTHDPHSAYRMADRIAFLEKSKLVFIGTPKEFQKSKLVSIQRFVAAGKEENLMKNI